jgi:exonuclease III
MGDMNSLSPQDPYDENVVLSEMHKVGLDKFGKGKLRYEVIKKILDFGFADSLKQFWANFEYSVPTVFNIDEAHFTKLRLDYIFVTRNLLPYLLKSEVIRTEETNQLSDHFPVAAEFNF